MCQKLWLRRDNVATRIAVNVATRIVVNVAAEVFRFVVVKPRRSAVLRDCGDIHSRTSVFALVTAVISLVVIYYP